MAALLVATSGGCTSARRQVSADAAEGETGGDARPTADAFLPVDSFAFVESGIDGANDPGDAIERSPDVSAWDLDEAGPSLDDGASAAEARADGMIDAPDENDATIATADSGALEEDGGSPIALSVDGGRPESGFVAPDDVRGELDAGTLAEAASVDGSGQAIDSATAGHADPAAVDEGAPPRIWVYVMAGQSNMLGQGNSTDLATADLQQVANAEIYFDSPLKTNVHMDSWLPVGSGFGWQANQIGPELGFARTFHALFPNRHLAIIKVSEGATELYDLWKAPGGSLYKLLTKTVTDQMRVLSARGRPQLAGFLWMQGESDGLILDHANAYQDNLAAMIRQLRADLGVTWLPAVAGLIATDCCWTYASTIRKATTLTATVVAQMDVVETDDLPKNATAPGHYSAAGQLALGARFANSVVALLETDWKLPGAYSGIQGESYLTYREDNGAVSTLMAFDGAHASWIGPSGASMDAKAMRPMATQRAELGWWAPFAGTFEIEIEAGVDDPQSAGTVLDISDGTHVLWGPRSVSPGLSAMTIFSRAMQQGDQLLFRTASGVDWNSAHDATWWKMHVHPTAIDE